MIYNKPLTISADTAIAAPASVSLPVVDGTLKQLFITFPAGCAGLVGVRVLFSERVIFPSNPDEWFIADNITFDFGENLKIDDKPFSFDLEGYNLDCIFDHTVTFRMAIQKEKADLLSRLIGLLPPVRVSEGAIIE